MCPQYFISTTLIMVKSDRGFQKVHKDRSVTYVTQCQSVIGGGHRNSRDIGPQTATGTLPVSEGHARQ